MIAACTGRDLAGVRTVRSGPGGDHRFRLPSDSFIVRIRSLENTRAAIVTKIPNHTSW